MKCTCISNAQMKLACPDADKCDWTTIKNHAAFMEVVNKFNLSNRERREVISHPSKWTNGSIKYAWLKFKGFFRWKR